MPKTHMLTRAQAEDHLRDFPAASVVLTHRDATLSHWQKTPVRLDEDGVLVHRHPTDAKGPDVQAPEGRYYVVDVPQASRDQIVALLAEASVANDLDQMGLCLKALEGDVNALRACSEVIDDNARERYFQAQLDA